MKFEMTIEEFTLVQNAIHYYKHIPKRGEFEKYDIASCEALRNKLSYQLVHEQKTIPCPYCDDPDWKCDDDLS